MQPRGGLSCERPGQESCLLTAGDAAPPWQITQGGLLSKKQMFSEDMAHPNLESGPQRVPKPHDETKKIKALDARSSTATNHRQPARDPGTTTLDQVLEVLSCPDEMTQNYI